MKYLHGVTTAMVTPFDREGGIMVEAAQAMVEFLIRRGVHCLYPCGTTGEMFLMPEAARKLMAETVVRQNAGRVITYIHVGAMDPEETVRLARHACDIGADGVGVVTPAFFHTNPDAMTRYYINVCHAVPDDFPVYLYNIPQCSANDLTVDVVKRIVDRCPNVAGIKYSFADMARTNDYLDVGDGFAVVHGADSLFLPTLAMGCAGTVSGVSSVYPEPFVRIYEAFVAGDVAKARELQKIANRFISALHGGVNMAIFKAGIAHRGIEGGHMHAPQIDLEGAERDALAATLAALEAGCPAGLLVNE